MSFRFRFAEHSVFLDCRPEPWAAELAYLREFLSPSIDVEEAPRPQRGERVLRPVRDPVRYESLLALRRGASRTVVCHVLDQGTLTAPAHPGEGGEVVFDDSHRVAYLLDGSECVTIVASGGLGVRRCLMRAVRETIQAALTPRSLVLHASAARWGDLGLVIAGPKLRGKTSFLVHLLRHGADYLANDRLVVEAGTLTCRGLPTLDKLRKSGIDLFPGLRDRLDRSGYHSHQTIEECRVSPRTPGRDPELSPAQLCALMGSRRIASSRLDVILLPARDPSTSGFELRPLAREESIARLAEVRFGPRHPGCVSEVFGEKARDAFVADDVWRDCAARAPIVECRMGPFETWGDPAALRASLLAVARSARPASASVPRLAADGASDPCRREEPASFEREIMVCAIAKNEGPNLVEWIEHHRSIGVTFFSIYDNDSDDDSASILAPYVRDGLAEVIPWPHHPGQLLAYADCVERHRGSARWIAFIDVDEYVVPPPGVMLPSFLEPYQESNGLGINWLTFGPSGHARRPPGLTMESYGLRSEERHPDNRHIKTIANPRRIVRTGLNPHYFVFADGGSVLDERLEPIPIGAFSRTHRSRRIRIRHYFTRSREELSAKLARGRATTSTPRRADADWDAICEELSLVRDEPSPADLERLRDRMGMTRSPQQTVAVVAIVKGEEPFVDEWLAYHRIIGVEHFYLYDNDPALPLRRLLEPHGDYVTVVEWPGEHEHVPGRNKQTKAYVNSLGRVRQDWVAFIDGDEFITLREHARLSDFLSGLGDADAVYLRWHMFGPNGHVRNPAGLITASLTRRREAPGRMGKTIARTCAIRSMGNAHHCELLAGRRYADPDRHDVSRIAHVNHYLCRSFENWMSRIERGEAAFARGQEPRTKDHRWRFDRELCERKFHAVAAEMDERSDDFMLRYEAPIRAFLARIDAKRAGTGARASDT